VNSIKPAISELERVYQELTPLFHRDMPLPVITVQSKGRKNALGWHWKDKWQNGQPDKLSEINLSAEYLARPAEEIAETLLHEMVHHVNALDGIRDCSINQYHNAYFKAGCDKIGMECEKSGRRGWAKTSLSPQLLETVEALHIDKDAFALFRTAKEVKKAVKQPAMWTCGCTNVQSRGDVEAVCQKCGKLFAKK
jgi:hypothetical protein